MTSIDRTTSGRRRPLPSPTRLFLEEHLKGRLPAIALAATALVLAVLYWSDVLPDRVAAALMASAVIAGGCGLAAGTLLAAARSQIDRWAAVILLTILAATVGWPLATALFPGTPAARFAAVHPGDSMRLPPSVRGPVRVLASAGSAQVGLFSCRPELTIGSQTEQLDLHRQLEAVRVGRRGRGTAMRDHTSAYAHGVLTDASDRLVVVGDTGSQTCTLELDVFLDRIPLSVEAGVVAALLLVLAAVAARSGAGPLPTVCAGVAAVFSLIAVGGATPEAAVRPAVGALLAGLPVGSAFGWASGWLVGKLVGGAPVSGG
jgi:hypothetical protein